MSGHSKRSDQDDTARVALQRLTDFMIEDILAASDEEIVAEAIEDGWDLEAIAAADRGLFEKVLAAKKARRPPNG
jgi:hypothetical protein